MFKKLILTLTFCTGSLTTQAAQLHFFSGYSRPEAVTIGKDNISLVRKGLGGFLLGGIGANLHPWKSISIEGSIFFSDCLRPGYEENKLNATKTISRTGILDLMIKLILPIPQLPTYMKAHVKTGLWGLYTLSKTCDLINKHAKPEKKDSLGYGWALGGGFSLPLPFWPKLPFEVSAAYYIPTTLPAAISDRLSYHLKHNCIQKGFWNIKVGIMWPQ